jgi:hypothetical protein
MKKISNDSNTSTDQIAGILKNAFESLNQRPVSPRRIAQSELNAHDLQRFVRVEGPNHQNPTEDLVTRSSRALSDFKKSSTSKYSKYLAPFRTKPLKKLEIAIKCDPHLANKKQNLMKNHASSSSNSPFLSGTRRFTSHQEYFAQNDLREHDNVSITISNTGRALRNSFNFIEEEEFLLPVGEHQRELVGTYTAFKKRDGDKRFVESSYQDTSGDCPVIYINSDADAKFAEAAGANNLPDWKPSLE